MFLACLSKILRGIGDKKLRFKAKKNLGLILRQKRKKNHIEAQQQQ